MSAVLERLEGARFAGVSFAYPGRAQAVLDHFDWQVEEGAFVVVSGESGSGKSTLLRCLNGLVPHFSGGRFGGSVRVAGLDTRDHGPRQLSASVGFVFQDPEAQQLTACVEDELAFGMEQLGVPPLTMRKRVEEVLDLLGIAALRRRDPATLSGGERQRVAVAAALAQQPRMLVLDEPTSQLDPWGAEEVIAALERLNHDLGLTVVLAEHRLERVLAAADRMLSFLPDGEIADGSPREIVFRLDDVALPPLVRLGRALEWTPLPFTIKEGRRALRREARVLPTPRGEAGNAPGTRVIDARGLTAGYGRTPVLREIDLAVAEGEIVALMGRNGSGKTTLLRTLMGLQRPQRGAIRVAGIDAARAAPHEVAKHAGYLPQRPSQLLFLPTLADELAFTARARGGGGQDRAALLAELELGGALDRNPRDLSVGEQERAALAAVLIGAPSVLLLDEPTRGMDARRKLALSRFLRRRQAAGVAVVLATHDVELVAETASRVVLLGDGEIVADGTPREVLSGSLTFATQINRLVGGRYLTVADVLGG